MHRAWAGIGITSGSSLFRLCDRFRIPQHYQSQRLFHKEIGLSKPPPGETVSLKDGAWRVSLLAVLALKLLSSSIRFGVLIPCVITGQSASSNELQPSEAAISGAAISGADNWT